MSVCTEVSPTEPTIVMSRIYDAQRSLVWEAVDGTKNSHGNGGWAGCFQSDLRDGRTARRLAGTRVHAISGRPGALRQRELRLSRGGETNEARMAINVITIGGKVARRPLP